MPVSISTNCDVLSGCIKRMCKGCATNLTEGVSGSRLGPSCPRWGLFCPQLVHLNTVCVVTCSPPPLYRRVLSVLETILRDATLLEVLNERPIDHVVNGLARSGYGWLM